MKRLIRFVMMSIFIIFGSVITYAQPSGLAMDNFITEAGKSLESSYSGRYGVSRDDEAVTINIWGDEMTRAAWLASNGTYRNDWESTRNYVRDISKTYYDTLKFFDREAHLRFSILNDQDFSNILAIFYDGNLEYDCVQSGAKVYYTEKTDNAAYASSQREGNKEENRHSMSYVCNTNTMKFHYPDCRSVKEIYPQNRSDVVASREELIAQGFDPCGRCKP